MMLRKDVMVIWLLIRMRVLITRFVYERTLCLTSLQLPMIYKQVILKVKLYFSISYYTMARRCVVGSRLLRHSKFLQSLVNTTPDKRLKLLRKATPPQIHAIIDAA